jgi:hypothetical protein
MRRGGRIVVNIATGIGAEVERPIRENFYTFVLTTIRPRARQDFSPPTPASASSKEKAHRYSSKQTNRELSKQTS